jgi:hypothetical protein
MSENKDISVDDVAKHTQNESKSEEVVRLKFSRREEMLEKLTALMTLTFKKASSKKTEPKDRQKWVTACGYLAQVAARIVTDTQYEKMRSDIDRLYERVLDPSARQGRNVRR